jgi:osmotically-inducible protein OsmY
VRSLFHKTEAEAAARRVKGARGIHNHVEVTVDASIRDVRSRIVRALHRNADLDANGISVQVDGHVATLTGVVTTFGQRETAEQAAAHAPGIAAVDNRIVVQPPVEPIDDQC